MFQSDPHWRDLLLFHEYFHGDNGAGLGASHQTGWTGLVALTATLVHSMAAEGLLADGLEAAFRRRPGASGAVVTGGRHSRSSTRSTPGCGWPSSGRTGGVRSATCRPRRGTRSHCPVSTRSG